MRHALASTRHRPPAGTAPSLAQHGSKPDRYPLVITDRIVPALTVVKALGLRSRLNVAASSVVASNAMRNPAIRSVGSDGLEGTVRSGHRVYIGRKTSPLVRGMRTEGALRCRRKFLRIFPGGFRDETYLAWEREYKWEAHEKWNELLDHETYRSLLRHGEFAEIAARAVKIEAQTNLIFSFEKMALRDAVKLPSGARAFAQGLYEFTYGAGDAERKFNRWCDVVAALPRKKTRVLTWPIVTVFGFIAHPKTHIFVKPNVTRTAAREYGFDFQYKSRTSWSTYASVLEFAAGVRQDLRDLHPRDMIDIQSFLWVQGSEEYAE
jgi:hypothetical protein